MKRTASEAFLEDEPLGLKEVEPLAEGQCPIMEERFDAMFTGPIQSILLNGTFAQRLSFSMLGLTCRRFYNLVKKERYTLLAGMIPFTFRFCNGGSLFRPKLPTNVNYDWEKDNLILALGIGPYDVDKYKNWYDGDRLEAPVALLYNSTTYIRNPDWINWALENNYFRTDHCIWKRILEGVLCTPVRNALHSKGVRWWEVSLPRPRRDFFLFTHIHEFIDARDIEEFIENEVKSDFIHFSLDTAPMKSLIHMLATNAEVSHLAPVLLDAFLASGVNDDSKVLLARSSRDLSRWSCQPPLRKKLQERIRPFLEKYFDENAINEKSFTNLSPQIQ